ncbi:MAG: T9SS type A sorting domain-containing protein [Crocinitomicaceae bacterium]|nr:T9SS type A sorting domain-containing protein [Crocinitomicaceae bacterium]
MDTGTKMTCDQNGFIYVVGTQGGNFNYNTETLIEPGYFIAKLDYNGNIIWAKGPDNITAAASNLYGIKFFNGGLYVAGKYNGTIAIDAISLISNGGWSDLFFAKLDTSGIAQWAYDAGSTTYDVCNDIAVTDSFVFITGAYSGTISFDTITRTADQSVAGSTGALNSRDAYIARYDSTGACHWVIEHKSLLADQGNSIYIDRNGDVLVAGNYLHSPDPTVAGSVGELRVSSYKQNGEFNWTLTSTGVNTGEGLAICPDHFGNVLLSGAVKNTHTFGGYSIPASSAVYSGIMAKILPPLSATIDQSLQSCILDTVFYSLDVLGGPITYDWYYGGQTLISDSGDSLTLLFDPANSDSISCVVSNGMETDTLIFNSPTFNFPLVNLGNNFQTCESVIELNAGSDGLYYDWGAGQNLYDSLLMVNASGTYVVNVTNADLCQTIDSIVVSLIDCTGFNSDVPDDETYDVYFNESLQAFIIVAPARQYDVTVFDVSGRLVLNKRNLSNNQSISTESLEKGVYLIMITDRESQVTTGLKCYKN